MSTNKTENYQLHSWEPEDDFLREEFNENFAKLDHSLRVISGRYSGTCSTNDSTPQRIELGIRPKAVLITLPQGITTGGGYSFLALAFPDVPAAGEALVLDDSGFTVKNASGSFILLNSRSYHYIALY